MHRWVGYLHGVQLGIADYFGIRPDWSCTRVSPFPENIRRLREIRADGVIAFVEKEYVRELRNLRIPVVDISNWMEESHLPRVVPDDLEIGRMAASHLLGLGLKHFAFVAPLEAAFVRLRLKGFSDAVAEKGFTVEPIWTRDSPAPSGGSPPNGSDTRVSALLHRLPKPLGIFGLTDDAASEVLEVCRMHRFRVPEEICMLGVDDDELITKVSHPPLSSISVPTNKIGYEAARLLDDLMAGGAPPAGPILLPPIGVVSRQSTNLLAISDADVQAAIRYIREQAHRQVTVRELLAAVPMNRRYLERKFQQHLGRTPLQEIRHTRLERAKNLLTSSDLSMPRVAHNSGFPNAARFAFVFHKQVGMTPSQYRRKFRTSE